MTGLLMTITPVHPNGSVATVKTVISVLTEMTVGTAGGHVPIVGIEVRR
jgi:hypothetical protein